MYFYYIILGYDIIAYFLVKKGTIKFFQFMSIPLILATYVIPCFGINAFMVDDKFSLMVMTDPEMFLGFRTILLWLLWLRMIPFLCINCGLCCMIPALIVMGPALLK
jgi:hypothetical protein